MVGTARSDDEKVTDVFTGENTQPAIVKCRSLPEGAN